MNVENINSTPDTVPLEDATVHLHPQDNAAIAKTDLEANEKRLDHLKDQLSASQKALVEQASGLSSPVIQELEKELGQEIARKAAMDRQVNRSLNEGGSLKRRWTILSTLYLYLTIKKSQ